MMALILEKSWSEKETVLEKYTVVFLPPPWVQMPVLLGWEKDVIPSSQISTWSTGQDHTTVCHRAHNSALGLSWRTSLKNNILSHTILKTWWASKINFSQNTQAVFHQGNRNQDLVEYYSNILTSLAMWVTYSSLQKILKWHDILMKLLEQLLCSSEESMMRFFSATLLEHLLQRNCTLCLLASFHSRLWTRAVLRSPEEPPPCWVQQKANQDFIVVARALLCKAPGWAFRPLGAWLFPWHIPCCTEPLPSTEAQWSRTNKCGARSLLAITLTLQCTTERCYSSILLHPVGLHTPTITVPSGNDFLRTATSYSCWEFIWTTWLLLLPIQEIPSLW